MAMIRFALRIISEYQMRLLSIERAYKIQQTPVEWCWIVLNRSMQVSQMYCG